MNQYTQIRTKCVGAMLAVLLTLPIFAGAQDTVPAEVAENGYADSIYVNGKVVSMDDHGYNNNVGHTYEALAVKKGRIVALNTTAYVKTLAGPKTTVTDLQGMTVIPGLIDTHNHNFGSGVAAQMGVRSPDNGMQLNVTAGKDMESTRLVVENAIKDSVAKSKEGDWIHVNITPNQKEDISANRIFSWVVRGELEPRDRLNRIAPKNPVIVQQASRATMNDAGWEIARKFLPNFDEYAAAEITDVPEAVQRGIIAVGEQTALTWNVFYRNQTQRRLGEVVRRGWERLISQGITTFASRVHNPRIMDTVTYVHRELDMPIRFGALYEVHRKPEDPAFVRKFYSYSGNLTGLGDDTLWIHGVASELWDSSFPQSCLGPDLPAPPHIKMRELCPKAGILYWDVLENAMKSGWRLAGVHGLASDGVRRFTQLIDKVVKETGMTAADVRALRPTIEHVEALGYVPDVMAKIKEYGIIINVNPPRLVREKEYIQDYGPKAEAFMMPVKKWLDEGFTVVGHFEGGAVGSTMNNLITREVNGRVVLPDQKLDRVVVLKLFTTWAPQYMLKEKVLGTLETGKYADFVVLDRDFFTVPEQQIPDVVPQLTVVGGVTRFLHPDFAKKLSKEPVGFQFPAGATPWRARIEQGDN
jgi:predicted amidohydrolase YtcJ